MIPTELKFQLFEFAGVVTVGEMDGYLVVGVESAQFLHGIPSVFEGVPVKVEVIGKIEPFATEA